MEDYPPTPSPTPSLTCQNRGVVYIHKPSTVNNVASEKTFITNLCGSIYIGRSFPLRDEKYFVYLVSLFDPKLRFDYQLFILFKNKNLLKIDETI